MSSIGKGIAKTFRSVVAVFGVFFWSAVVREYFLIFESVVMEDRLRGVVRLCVQIVHILDIENVDRGSFLDRERIGMALTLDILLVDQLC